MGLTEAETSPRLGGAVAHAGPSETDTTGRAFLAPKQPRVYKFRLGLQFISISHASGTSI